MALPLLEAGAESPSTAPLPAVPPDLASTPALAVGMHPVVVFQQTGSLKPTAAFPLKAAQPGVMPPAVSAPAVAVVRPLAAGLVAVPQQAASPWPTALATAVNAEPPAMAQTMAPPGLVAAPAESPTTAPPPHLVPAPFLAFGVHSALVPQQTASPLKAARPRVMPPP